MNPTVTFIVTIINNKEFSIEQINAIFKFSERYEGFCEILVLAGQVDETRIKLAWLAMKLNQTSHPHVRTRMIRYTSEQSLVNLVETSINLALGQRIAIITTAPEVTENTVADRTANRDILLSKHTLDADLLRENLHS